jgi:hypothetical protein
MTYLPLRTSKHSCWWLWTCKGGDPLLPFSKPAYEKGTTLVSTANIYVAHSTLQHAPFMLYCMHVVHQSSFILLATSTRNVTLISSSLLRHIEHQPGEPARMSSSTRKYSPNVSSALSRIVNLQSCMPTAFLEELSCARPWYKVGWSGYVSHLV